MSTLEEVRRRAEDDAKHFGYYLTPQPELLQMFIEGLKINQDRYGYPLCPCRLTSGNYEYDRDIICPCDYRDPDVAQYGACYCRLYVNKQVYESQNLPEVPERRPFEKQARAYNLDVASAKEAPASKTEEKTPTPPAAAAGTGQPTVKKKLWYCKQCGYVVFREDPPYICPICRAKREMFAEITSAVELNG